MTKKQPAVSKKKMFIKWDIFLKDNEKNKITISLERGKCLFIVGANGSGKSALIQQCISELHRKEIDFERYSAHRQPWFVAEVT